MQTPFVPAEYVSLFFHLFENSSDAVFLVRVGDRVLVDVNGSMLSMFKLTREEAIGRAVDNLGMLVQREEFDDILREAATTGSVERRPVRFRNRSSDEFTLGLSAAMTQLRGDDVILVIGTLPRRQLSA